VLASTVCIDSVFEMSGFFDSDDEEERIPTEEEAFLVDTIDDDDDEIVTPEDEDSYWVSKDQLKDVAGEKQGPQTSDWKFYHEEYGFSVTVDKARREMWKQGKAEIKLALRNVENLVPPTIELGPGALQDALFKKIMGPDSKMGKHFIVELGLSRSEYCTFMATFYTSCQFNTSLKIIQSSPRFNSKFLMSLDRYNAIWRKISNDRDVKRSTQTDFWMDIERIYNADMKFLFMPAPGADTNEFQFAIALDDDKVHYAFGRNIDTHGLKKQRHVKANRTGFTLHTCVHAASSLVIRIDWNRERDTCQSCYKRAVLGLFANRDGDGGLPNLSNVTFNSDRGYWLVDLLFYFLLPAGADVLGTVKRCLWFPYTYDAKGTKKQVPGKPLILDPKAYKNCSYKMLKWGKAPECRELFAFAYRNGTSSVVSLAMSTVHPSPTWDFNTYNPPDAKWYFDTTLTDRERLKKGFPFFCGQEDDDDIDHLAMNVKPRTVGQCSADWFLDRKFSLTSSTVDKAARAAAPEIGPSHEKRRSFELVLNYAGLSRLLPKTDEEAAAALPREDEDEDEGLERPPPPAAAVDADDSSDGNESPPPPPLASVRRTIEPESDDSSDDSLTHPPPGPAAPTPPIKTLAEEAQDWLTRIAEPLHGEAVENELKAGLSSMSIGLLSAMLDQLQLTIPKSVVGNLIKLKKKVEEWLGCPRGQRRYFAMSRPALLNEVKSRKIKCTGNAAVKKLRELLAASDCKPEEQQRQSYESTDPVLLAVLTASFMKPQKTSIERSYTRQGQDLEEPFLRQLWEHSAAGMTGKIKIKSLYRPGLVVRTKDDALNDAVKHGAVKDSVDSAGIYIEEIDGSESDSSSDTGGDGQAKKVIPIEVKARVATSTCGAEKAWLMKRLGAEEYSPREVSYVHIEASEINDVFPRDHESFQLLHHVYTYDSDKGLMIVGSNMKLLFGAFVSFTPELKSAWGDVLQYIYERALKWAYGPREAIPLHTIKNVLASDNMKSFKVDSEAFITNYSLWRKLNVDVERHFKFPIPPCSRILPIQHSSWNIGKGGSDTTTKLNDNCEERLGVRTPQTTATARMVLLYAVSMHREFQMIGARKDLDYPSLHHYRHAANQRTSFANSLDKVVDMFLTQASVEQEAEDVRPLAGNTNTGSQEPDSPGTRNRFAAVCLPITPAAPRTRAHDDVLRTNWMQVHSHMITPGRGQAVNPKNPTRPHSAWELRNDDCMGLTLVSRLEKKQGSNGKDQYETLRAKCVLCKVQTSTYCTGCRRYLCFDKDRRKQQKQQGKEPTQHICKMKQLRTNCNTQEENVEEIFGYRSCYQIAHEKQFNLFWKDCSTYYSYFEDGGLD
jgi:hypothetical protein